MAFRLHYGPNGQQVWVEEPDAPPAPRYTAYDAEGVPMQEGNPYYKSGKWAEQHPDDVRVVNRGVGDAKYDADGNLISADPQKEYYGAKYQEYQHLADDEGKYSWYGVERHYDSKAGAYNTAYDNLTAKSQADPGSVAGREYWKYSDAPPREYFQQQEAAAPNLSKQSRYGSAGMSY